MAALNKEQEEAICEMYRQAGFEECYQKVNEYMIKNFGKEHKHTIDLRLLIQPILCKINEDSRRLIDDSGLVDVFMRRIDDK